MDPDLVKDIKGTQGRMLKMQNQLQSGDYTRYVAAGHARPRLQKKFSLLSSSFRNETNKSMKFGFNFLPHS
jgi:hypothetical protein